MTLTKHGTGAALVAGPKAFKGGPMGNLVEIKVTRSTMAGGERVEAGQIIKASERDARDLIALGKAVPVSQGAPEVQNRDEEVAKTASKRANAKKKEKED